MLFMGFVLVVNVVKQLNCLDPNDQLTVLCLVCCGRETARTMANNIQNRPEQKARGTT